MYYPVMDGMYSVNFYTLDVDTTKWNSRLLSSDQGKHESSEIRGIFIMPLRIKNDLNVFCVSPSKFSPG